MCVPECTKKIAHDLSRRRFLLGSVGAAAVVAGCVPISPERTSSNRSVNATPTMANTIAYDRVVDLTHALPPEFPTYFGVPGLEIETEFSLEIDGFNAKHWRLNEHTGTHMDAPFHFSDQDTADEIPVENLIGPLVIIDIRAKVEENSDAQLTPDDLAAWEAEHGAVPAGGIVAMFSGWDQHVHSDKFRNADDEGIMHFPGFHVEAVEFLIEERDVKGIMVDSLSLDYGPSADFATHYRWLPANRWAIENVANLGELPSVGATVIVGGPKVVGATGGPSRVIALA